MFRFTALAASVVMFSLLSAGVARADAEVNCAVKTVAWSVSPGGKFMYLICANNTVHLAYSSAGTSGCPTTDIESVKIWQSYATAAKLSGKVLTLSYSNVTCAGASPKRMLNGIELTP